MVNIPPLDKTLEESTPLPQDRQKRKRTKGPINSLETAIDENNYENYVRSIPKNSIESEIDKVPYKWEKSAVSRECPNVANTSKRSARSEKGCRNNTSIIEIWKQFITMEIVNLILHYTNLKINAFLDTLDQEKKPYYACATEATELLAFFGFFYARGLLHHNLMDIENLFSEKVGHQIYSSTISLNLFKFMKRMITFNDSTTRNDRWKKDKFSAFREVLEMFNKQCARNYLPDDFLAIDETLYPT